LGAFGEKVVTLPPQTVGAGDGSILVNVTMPEGYKFNGQAPFTAIWPENAVAQIAADSRDIRIILPEMPLEVPVTFNEGLTDLTVDLTVYWCEAVNETLCFVERAQLTMPLTVTADNESQTAALDYALVPPTVEENTFQ
jgi:hypothetical protein